MQKPSENVQAVVLLCVLSLIWGTSFILIKRGLEVFSPPEVGSLRVAAASTFLVPLAIGRLKALEGHHFWKLMASGFMGIFFPAFLFAFAQTRLESSVTGILNTLTPICTLLVGAVLFGQHFSRRSLLGIVAGLGGSYLLITANAGGGLGGMNASALLIILACVLYGTNLNFIKYRITDLNAITITSVSLLLIGPFALIYLLGFTGFLEKMQVVDGAWESFGYVLLLGLMSTSLATILFNKLVKISSPLYTSSVTYLIPIVAVGWGVLDGEQLFAGHLAGMAAIIGGVYLANRKA